MSTKFVNMLVQTGTLIAASSAASINLGAAAPTYRALADALTATASNPNALKVGDTTYFKISDSAGNWEIGLYTVTSATRLDRLSVLDGTNGTSATVFSGGVTVTQDFPASFLFNLLTQSDGVTIKGLTARGTLLGTDLIELEDTNGNGYSASLSALQSFLGVSTGTPTPAESLTVATPGTQTAGTAFNVTGTYANATPSAFDYSIDGGTTWTPAPTPTIGGGNYSFSLTIASANAAEVLKVRDHGAQTVIATSAAFVVNAVGTPPESLTVATPGTQTVGTAYNVTGTYANGTPLALDYSIDGGTTWTPAPTPTISGGNYSFSVTPSTASASRTMKVRDHNNTSAVATSGTYVVNAIAPGAPTIGTATAGDTTASFAFAAPASTGGAAITGYTLTVYNASNAVVGTFTGAASPIQATGLADGTGVYGKVAATNSAGLTGAQSAASNTVTPAASVSYQVAPYGTDSVKSTIDATSASVYGSLKLIQVGPLQFSDGYGYWTISPTPPSDGTAMAYAGWVPAGSAAPTTTITAAQNAAAGSSINGLVPMAHPGAFQAQAWLVVPVGSGTTSWDFYVKPSDGPAQKMGTATVNNA